MLSLSSKDYHCVVPADPCFISPSNVKLSQMSILMQPLYTGVLNTFKTDRTICIYSDMQDKMMGDNRLLTFFSVDVQFDKRGMFSHGCFHIVDTGVKDMF